MFTIEFKIKLARSEANLKLLTHLYAIIQRKVGTFHCMFAFDIRMKLDKHVIILKIEENTVKFVVLPVWTSFWTWTFFLFCHDMSQKIFYTNFYRRSDAERRMCRKIVWIRELFQWVLILNYFRLNVPPLKYFIILG